MTARPARAPHGGAPGGRIGPNAIIQTCAELAARPGASDTDTILRDAGIPWAANAPPSEMVSEEDVRRLFLAVERCQPAAAPHLLHAAGHRTARYLLANRIPRPVQWLLRCLPARQAARVLLSAIGRNAWTFAGTGTFSSEVSGHRAIVRIEGCPICRGVRSARARCDFYAGTFDGLAGTLLGRHGRAREVTCMAKGDPACTFVIEWTPRADHPPGH